MCLSALLRGLALDVWMGDHPACVSADGKHFKHMMVVAVNMA